MQYESILIVTYGRSGSTLLQGLLNSIDGMLIRGENFNFNLGLYETYKALHDAHSRFGTGDICKNPIWPWFGAHLLNEEIFLTDARRMIRNQLLSDKSRKDVKCIGFKEIRYLPDDGIGVGENYLDGYLDFLAKVFPISALVFLTRDHDQVASSGWWAACDRRYVIDQIARFERAADHYAKGNSACFHITYQDIIDKTQRLRDLYRFLGVPFDEKLVDDVLAIEHSVDARAETHSKVSNYTLYISESDAMEEVALHDLPWQVTEGELKELHGVVIPSDVRTGQANLLAVDSVGEHAVQWGLDSPRYARRFPENPHAASARFKTGRLRISKEKSVELYLVDEAGKRELLVCLALKGKPDEST